MGIIQGTPWEIHDDIHVKREDLSCPYPGPQFSKVRGVWEQLLKVTGPEALVRSAVVGVVDSRHSKAGWGVAYLAKQLPWPVEVKLFYPTFVNESLGQLRESQINAEKCGATLMPLNGRVMSAVLFNQAKAILAASNPTAYMFPNGLKLNQSVDATAFELQSTLPEGWDDTNALWVVSASSATIAAGVCKGLQNWFGRMPQVLIHLGYSRPEHSVRECLTRHGVYVQNHIKIVDEGYKYADFVTESCPFPCNPYYDLKAWKWIKAHRNDPELKSKHIFFWNIGA